MSNYEVCSNNLPPGFDDPQYDPQMRYNELEQSVPLEVVPPPEDDLEPRLQLLEKVGKLISQDRNKDYGDPMDNLSRTCDLVKAYLGERKGTDLEPHDVAVLGILLKVGRLAHDREKDDSWADICGYSAIGFEVMKMRRDGPR